MIILTKAQVAVSALLDLAKQDHGQPVTLCGIAERTGISQSYLEQLFAKLRRAGILKSVRGPGGGYRLDRPADAITVGEIVQVVDGEPDEEPAPAFSGALAAAMNYLGRVTLASLAVEKGA